jgi:8-oxo-dGTP diphosphatase
VNPAYVPESAEERRFLASYDPRAYDAIGVTVDVVVLTIRAGGLSVLLVNRTSFPHRGAWALPGGFVAVDEDLDAAAKRELAEETGLKLDGTGAGAHLEQLRTYGRPGRDPRMRVISVVYLALVPDLPTPGTLVRPALRGSARSGGSDASDARFWAVDDLAGEGAGALAFDHGSIVADAVERARAKLEYTPLATSFTAEPFTLGELRRIYEAVWGVSLHAPNFRRKVLSTPGFVLPVGERSEPGDGGGRPAELYRRGDATLLHPAFLRPPA